MPVSQMLLLDCTDKIYQRLLREQRPSSAIAQKLNLNKRESYYEKESTIRNTYCSNDSIHALCLRRQFLRGKG